MRAGRPPDSGALPLDQATVRPDEESVASARLPQRNQRPEVRCVAGQPARGVLAVVEAQVVLRAVVGSLLGVFFVSIVWFFEREACGVRRSRLLLLQFVFFETLHY